MLVVTALETWFALHNISGLLFQAAGLQRFPPCIHASRFCDSWWVHGGKINKTPSNFHQFLLHCRCSIWKKVPSHVQPAGICWVSHEKVHECQHYPIVQPHCATSNLDFHWNELLWITFIAWTYFWLLVHVCVCRNECDSFIDKPATSFPKITLHLIHTAVVKSHAFNTVVMNLSPSMD